MGLKVTWKDRAEKDPVTLGVDDIKPGMRFVWMLTPDYVRTGVFVERLAARYVRWGVRFDDKGEDGSFCFPDPTIKILPAKEPEAPAKPVIGVGTLFYPHGHPGAIWVITGASTQTAVWECARVGQPTNKGREGERQLQDPKRYHIIDGTDAPLVEPFHGGPMAVELLALVPVPPPHTCVWGEEGCPHVVIEAHEVEMAEKRAAAARRDFEWQVHVSGDKAAALHTSRHAFVKSGASMAKAAAALRERLATREAGRYWWRNGRQEPIR